MIKVGPYKPPGDDLAVLRENTMRLASAIEGFARKQRGRVMTLPVECSGCGVEGHIHHKIVTPEGWHNVVFGTVRSMDFCPECWKLLSAQLEQEGSDQ